MTKRPTVGVSTSAFFPRPIAETFAILDAQPWRGVELMPQAPYECTPAYGRELLEIAAGRFDLCGIHFPQILAPFVYNPDPHAFAFGQELARDVAELAGTIGARTIVVHGPWTNMGEGAFLEAGLANLRTMCDVGRHHGVTIAVENTPSSYVGTSPRSMVDFAALIDRPNVGFTFDVTHTYQMGLEPWPFLEELSGIAHVHASDFELATKRRHTVPGDGDVDWRRVLRVLADGGFTGNFILELVESSFGADPAATLRSAAALLDPLLDEVYGPSQDAA